MPAFERDVCVLCIPLDMEMSINKNKVYVIINSR